MAQKMLVEKWKELIEVDGATPIPTDLHEAMATLLENEEQYIAEGSVQGDMAQFTPILIPAIRRIFPNLLAHEIVGVQPLNAPTGYAYALRYAYGNDNGIPGARTDTTVTKGVGNTNMDVTANGGPQFGSIAVALTPAARAAADLAGWAVNLTAAEVKVADTNVGGNATAILGAAVYVESGKVLIKLTTVGTVSALAIGGNFISLDDGATWYEIGYVMNNEAGYNLIFKNMAGPWSTADGEKLGGYNGNPMKTAKMTLERVSVEAQTRKMKAEYTVELAQDLKNVHGLDAEAELINILEYEITAEIDRDLIDQINAAATVTSAWTYGGAGQSVAATPTSVADGRWEQEKFRTLYTRILREANMIALTTRRGAGNFVVASINAVTALEGLNSFMYSAVPGSITQGAGIVKVGTLDGRFNVYVDTFAQVDYVTVGYKGASNFDTGVIYCPYIPLMMQKVVDPDTFQPKVGFMQRSAVVNNLYGAENYYRTFYADFTYSSLAGTYF